MIGHPGLWYDSGKHGVLMRRRTHAESQAAPFDRLRVLLLSDQRADGCDRRLWADIEPMVTTSSPKGGRPAEIDLRAIVHVLISEHHTRCHWRMRLADVLPISAVRSANIIAIQSRVRCSSILVQQQCSSFLDATETLHERNIEALPCLWRSKHHFSPILCLMRSGSGNCDN